MPQSGWAGVATPAIAAVRSAESLLRAIGAASVQFRFPLAGSTTGDGAQLGCSQPQMEEITVAPVVVRTWQCPAGVTSGFELVIAASSLRQLAETRGAKDVTSLISEVASIGWGERSFRVQKITCELFAGCEYLYRLQVAE